MIQSLCSFLPPLMFYETHMYRYASGTVEKTAHLTCPAWRSDGHRSSFQECNQPPGDRCSRAFSGHNGILDILPGHHGKDSRKHRIPPLGWHQSDSHPSIQPFKIQANNQSQSLYQLAFCDFYPNIILSVLSIIKSRILLSC